MKVELIQELIKKLADELNSTVPRHVDAESEPALEPANETEAMIGRSVAALDTTARTMRAAAPDPASAPASREAGTMQDRPVGSGAPQRSGQPALDPKLARIAEAVAAERIEVLLEPIHALAEGRARHYEVSMRLLTADGTSLEQSEYTPAALGSGLMPRIDAARMLRAARIARRLGERGRQASVLAAMAGESLTDEQIPRHRRQAARHRRAHRPRSVVCPRRRSHLHAGARRGTWHHGRRRLRLRARGGDRPRHGFRRAEGDGLRVRQARRPGVSRGAAGAGGRIPAADICRYLAEFGLTLIVGRIEDDWLLARILGFGVLLGKGALFGGPKLVKAEVVAEPGTAAA